MLSGKGCKIRRQPDVGLEASHHLRVVTAHCQGSCAEMIGAPALYRSCGIGQTPSGAVGVVEEHSQGIEAEAEASVERWEEIIRNDSDKTGVKPVRRKPKVPGKVIPPGLVGS